MARFLHALARAQGNQQEGHGSDPCRRSQMVGRGGNTQQQSVIHAGGRVAGGDGGGSSSRLSGIIAARLRVFTRAQTTRAKQAEPRSTRL
jgi:hypothetical protein